MTVTIRTVYQSFDGGRTGKGLRENWRMDQESRDLRAVCDEIDAYNRVDGFAKWYEEAKAECFTWDAEVELNDDGTLGKQVGNGIPRRVLWSPKKARD